MDVVMEDGVRVAGFPRNKVESLCVVGYDGGKFWLYMPETDEMLSASHMIVQPAAQRVLDNAK